jgi:hypothetical protein
MSQNRKEIARASYLAYESGDREILERHLSDEFVFYGGLLRLGPAERGSLTRMRMED